MLPEALLLCSSLKNHYCTSLKKEIKVLYNLSLWLRTNTAWNSLTGNLEKGSLCKRVKDNSPTRSPCGSILPGGQCCSRSHPQGWEWPQLCYGRHSLWSLVFTLSSCLYILTFLFSVSYPERPWKQHFQCQSFQQLGLQWAPLQTGNYIILLCEWRINLYCICDTEFLEAYLLHQLAQLI